MWGGRVSEGAPAPGGPQKNSTGDSVGREVGVGSKEAIQRQDRTSIREEKVNRQTHRRRTNQATRERGETSLSRGSTKGSGFIYSTMGRKMEYDLKGKGKGIQMFVRMVRKVENKESKRLTLWKLGFGKLAFIKGLLYLNRLGREGGK